MKRTAAYATAAILFVAGTILLLFADRIRRGRAEPKYETIAVLPDESWKLVDWLKEYQLVERAGPLFDSHSLDGKVHVVSFFFTMCATACPLQNTQVRLLHDDYASHGVKFVSITCDPETDTPKQLREYAQKYRAGADSWLFLTGDLLHIRRIGAEIYQVPVDRLTHSEKLIVVDRWGQIRGRFHWSKTDELAKLRLLLDRLIDEQQPPPAEPDAPRRAAPDPDDASNSEDSDGLDLSAP